MARFINTTVNNVRIPADAIEALNGALEDIFPSFFREGRNAVSSEGKLFFDDEMLDYVDWLTPNEMARSAVAATGAEGDVCFASEEGLYAGKAWGVRFNGDGTHVTLVGALTYKPVET